MYNHKLIEEKWRKYWEVNNVFKTTDNKDQKFYVLDMFPYPSGSGLHVGHPEGYTATDIIARYKRLKGFDVLHPIGWDAFGLPAEQYALKTNNHPEKFTDKNINRFRRQLKSLGFSFDYNKEVNTTDPAYYKTTQWIFNQIYKKGLAEIKNINVNWSEKLGTVLANEEVVEDENGNPVSEVGGFPVIKKPMKQWVLKITDYAKRLYDGLDNLDWPESLKALQRNWIYNEDGTMHLQDWIFSRQRYWGEPFPVAFSEAGKILLINELPVKLPSLKDFKSSGTGESPLANATDWLYLEKDGERYRRETNTMPQWAGSCWYYLAYILKQENGSYLDIDSKEAFEQFSKWLPVDLYIGGQEHAVLHLMYARFWHMVLYDIGIVPTEEPFRRIINQGMILGPDGQKMSKSKGNVINPDDIIDDYGADTLRIYEMFMGPLEETKPWNDESIKGVRKWLERVYRLLANKDIYISKENDKQYNSFIKGVTDDIDNMKFNTAISKMMVYINHIYKVQKISISEANGFLTILSLFAPYISEELLKLNNMKQVQDSTWPKYDGKNLYKSKLILAIQVNGKLRAKIEISENESKDQLLKRAKLIPNVSKYLTSNIKKEVYIPKKIINFVI